MQHEITLTILDRGYIVTDGDVTQACTSGQELLNIIARTKQALDTDKDEE